MVAEKQNSTNTVLSTNGEMFEDVLEKVGGFGLYQKWIFVLTCYPYFIAGFFMLNPVFILGVPEHRCAIPGYDNDTYEIQGEEHLFRINVTIPLSTVEGRKYDRCKLFQFSNDNERYMYVIKDNSCQSLKQFCMIAFQGKDRFIGKHFIMAFDKL